MHIYTVTVHLQNNFIFLHIIISIDVGVFFVKMCKLSTFYILQIFETIDAVVLTFLMVLSFAMEIVLLPIK